MQTLRHTAQRKFKRGIAFLGHDKKHFSICTFSRMIHQCLPNMGPRNDKDILLMQHIKIKKGYLVIKIFGWQCQVESLYYANKVTSSSRLSCFLWLWHWIQNSDFYVKSWNIFSFCHPVAAVVSPLMCVTMSWPHSNWLLILDQIASNACNPADCCRTAVHDTAALWMARLRSG